ncbi:DUF1835 domain-containing protein [Planococcus salinus]|uniref:DUF1835 domain-containing protein n=1 Tax=Planococcus salinus TaxID=1848460 RepID=A0A3M8PBY0_9BACL|nr:DUF1835 domain-containing protein [Planococcus salinus]RNF41228.1 DUF1835 domain-containing protein [Planococcus salinus]
MVKTKINDPFIYFLLEPTTVLVYRNETHTYVSVSDLMDPSKWEAFEIEQGETFETFNRKEKQPIEGTSFFLNQEDMAEIAEEINEHIQKNRHLKKPEKQVGAVHLVVSESVAGSLRIGLERPKTVIGFPDAFSIGPLWKLEEKTGQSFREEWLLENINFEQEDDEYKGKFTNALREIEDIENQVPIYIWGGDNAEEQTGLRFFLYMLGQKTNEIFLLNTTKLYEKYFAAEDEPAIFHTGQLDAEKLQQFFENSKKDRPLTQELRRQYQSEWEELSKTKEVLRVWIDGQIRTVAEDYFDSMIIETLEKLHQKQETKDFVLTGKLIGEIVTQTDEFINYLYLEYRIRHLVYSGVFELKGIPKSMRHYSVKLR